MENLPIRIIGKYTTAEMFANTIEEGVYNQIYDIINSPAFQGKRVLLMPDVHVGASGPCGLVAEIGDYICPEHIGVDIGCSVTMLFLNKKISREKLALLEHRIKKAIPMGFNLNETSQIEDKEFYKFLSREFKSAKSIWPEMLEKLPVNVDERWVSKRLKELSVDEGVFYKSLGTLGGGNHFIEYGETPDKGAITFHCGSRNFGVKVCKYWMKETSVGMSKKEIRDAINKIKNDYMKSHKNMKNFDAYLKKNLTLLKNNHLNGYLEGETMKGYICDMVFAQAYAKYNHETIIKAISKVLLTIDNTKIVDKVTCTHNYIDMRDRLLRKSSISAHKGEKIIVPLNMKDGTALCVGKGNPVWMESCSHGAGRKMSRSEAKRNISLEEFKSSMEGIVSTSVNTSTIDESPMAYKNSDEILGLIADTCEIINIVKPLVSWKASDDVE